MRRLLVFLLALTWLAPAAVAAEARRPSVIVIVADDMGAGDLSGSGNADAVTPHLDALGRDGARCTQFIVCPVCAPTRAELLTGRWHLRTGVRDVSRGGERLNADEETLGQVFRRAGYATGAFGKWHNGSQWPHHPRAFGFDAWCGYTSGHWGTYHDAVLEDAAGKPVRAEGYLTDFLTSRAMEFIGQHRDRPFLCWLGMPVPHSPMQVPDEWWARVAGKPLAQPAGERSERDRDFTRAAHAMNANMDWNIGRLLAQLRTLGIERDTIVVFLSDNGPNNPRWNAGLKGIKGSVDEGGVRSVCHIRWPAAIAPGTVVSRVCGAVDLLPTLTDCAGIAAPPARPLDGRSIRPLLEGRTDGWPDRRFFSHWAGKFSVRTDRWRLDTRGALFDLVADPGQARDAAAAHPDIVKDLAAALTDWRTAMAPGLAPDTRPFPVGWREFPVAPLPARDGVPHDGVQRSAQAPNCSFFPAWREPAGRITWEIETPAAVTCEVALQAAWRHAGTALVLAAGDASLSLTLAGTHDPPAFGPENDRVPRRGESVMKAFRAVPMGRLTLPAGRSTLTLRAAAMPGGEAADVGGLVLTRID